MLILTSVNKEGMRKKKFKMNIYPMKLYQEPRKFMFPIEKLYDFL